MHKEMLSWKNVFVVCLSPIKLLLSNIKLDVLHRMRGAYFKMHILLSYTDHK